LHSDKARFWFQVSFAVADDYSKDGHAVKKANAESTD